MINHYHIGCPIWRNKDWKGTLFTRESKSNDFLKQYAMALNTVEGNSTFYSLPSDAMVWRWKNETPADFRFSFKFPRKISHRHQLINVEEETSRFFKVLEALEDQLGVLFLQLPPSFDRAGLAHLEKYLQSLPEGFRYAVEVRHLDFFDEGEIEKSFHELLLRLQVNRVLFDTTTLHQLDTTETSVLEAQRKKPKVPERFVVTGKHPFVRFVGSNQIEPNLPRLTYIATLVAQWIDQGLDPYLFMHSPDDYVPPQLCRTFHQLLSNHVKEKDIGTMPNWPGETVTKEQLNLF